MFNAPVIYLSCLLAIGSVLVISSGVSSYPANSEEIQQGLNGLTIDYLVSVRNKVKAVYEVFEPCEEFNRILSEEMKLSSEGNNGVTPVAVLYDWLRDPANSGRFHNLYTKNQGNYLGEFMVECMRKEILADIEQINEDAKVLLKNKLQFEQDLKNLRVKIE